MSKFLSWLRTKPRTIDAPMECIFHRESKSEWFTKENRDRIPCCTDCGLQLVPANFKRVLVSGVFEGDADSDPGSCLSAACAGTVMLWAYLNSITKSLPLESIPTKHAFGSTEYGHWPNLDQEEFIENIAEGTPLGNSILGDVSGARPYLALVSNLLNWTVVDSGRDHVVKIWPSPLASAIHDGNFSAAIRYLEESQRTIPNQQIWDLFRKIVSLINKAQENSSKHKLFGFRVTTESLGQPKVKKARDFLDAAEHQNQDLFDLESPDPLGPLDANNPRRVVPRLSIGNKIFGAFEPTYRTKCSSREVSSKSLEVIHETSFSVVVRALNQDQARQIIRSSLFEAFGFTLMARTGHKWRLNGLYGVDWDIYPRSAEPWYQSKITSIEPIASAEWEGTPWQSQCI